MEIKISIPDEELQEMVASEITKRLVRELCGERGFGFTFRRDVKAIIREVIRENIDVLSDQAVSAASKSIENRAVKKLMDKLMEDEA